MENNYSESTTSSDDFLFRELIQRGDDFYKIELLRQALYWYRKALDINTKSEMVKSRISECERLLIFEKE